MNQPEAHQPGGAGPALRPITGLIGRGSELGRLLGHLDAGRSVRLDGPRGVGSTALLRALCAEPPRPGTADGSIALPVGLPVGDLGAVAQRLEPGVSTTVDQRRMLVLLDDRGVSAAELTELQRTFARSVLVVTGGADSAADDLSPVGVHGLSQHHAVGLIEAAMGRPLSIDEGRSARVVATALDGMPAWLIQAAATVRAGGLTFDDVRDLLDDPPRPTALTVALQHGLDDELHVTMSHVRALGDVPVTTPVAAAACGLDQPEVVRRLRRLSVLGLAFTDGRDGWTAASGLPPVSEPIRAGAAERVAAWLQDSGEILDVFDVASVLAAVADRVDAGDQTTTQALASAALDRLPLTGMAGTTALLEGARSWSESRAADEEQVEEDAVVLTASVVGGVEAAPGHDGSLVDETDAPPPDAGRDAPQEGLAEEALGAADEPPPPAPPPEPTVTDSGSALLTSLFSNRRRLAMIAVAAAAVIAAVLLVVPSLRGAGTDAVLRGDIDLGVASVGESSSGTLTLDLTESDALAPVALVLDGPDADAFAVDPQRCDSLDCRASVTFTPDRSGTHVATVRAVDDSEVERAVVELTGSGTGDPPDLPVNTNLAITLFPSEPSPIPAGGSAALPVGVSNNGPDDSTGARLVLTVPDEVSAQAAGCSFEASTLTCPVADLPAGTQARVQVTLTVPTQATEVRVNATVTPLTDVDDAEGDNSAGFTYPVQAPATPDPT